MELPAPDDNKGKPMHPLAEHIKKLSLVATFVLVAFVLLIQPHQHSLNPDNPFTPDKSISEDLLMKSLEDLMNIDVVYLSELPSEYIINGLLNKSIEDLMNIDVGYSS